MNVDVFQNPDCFLRVSGALFARDLTHDRQWPRSQKHITDLRLR